MTAVGRLGAVSLDCNDPEELATFYGELLGLQRIVELPDIGVIALSDGTPGGVAVAVMRTPDYAPPTWPGPGKQVHLDVSVTDLDTAVAGALALGAREATTQAMPTLWRVMLDPAGHPFCLTTMGA